MRKFGIYTNLKKDADLSITRRVIEVLQKRGLDCYFDSETARALGAEESLWCDHRRIDILLVLGGDGTMLAASRKYAATGAYLLGLNLGRLGFLLDTKPENLEEALDQIQAGKYELQQRLMLEAFLQEPDGKMHLAGYALNEAVVSQKNKLRIIHLEIDVDDQSACSYWCDGVIISSPTGSTAYSLSAGGPVVAPTVNVLLVTPLCPHSLRSRSFVVDGASQINVRVHRGVANIALALDGQDYLEVPTGWKVLIRKAGFTAKFLRTAGENFYTVLQEKLAEWR